VESFQAAKDYSQNAELRSINERLGVIAANVQELKADVRKTLDDHEFRLRKLEIEQTTLSARVTMGGILQTSFAAIVAGIAAIVGAVFK
jgi:hypothetical protein